MILKQTIPPGVVLLVEGTKPPHRHDQISHPSTWSLAALSVGPISGACEPGGEPGGEPRVLIEFDIGVGVVATARSVIFHIPYKDLPAGRAVR